MTEHEGKKEADPATPAVQENDRVVGTDRGNTNTIIIAAPKPGEDGIDGNLCEKDTRLLEFARASYDRESGIMNARKKIETWNAGVKEELEAISQVRIRGADFRDFRELVKIRVAHYEDLCKGFPKYRLGGLVTTRTCTVGSSVYSRAFPTSWAPSRKTIVKGS